MSEPYDPPIITLVYSAEANKWLVDIGSVDPAKAAVTLGEAADEVEDWVVRPEYTVVINGVEQVAVPEPEED